jgi:dihydroneopterin aldolase
MLGRKNKLKNIQNYENVCNIIEKIADKGKSKIFENIRKKII